MIVPDRNPSGGTYFNDCQWAVTTYYIFMNRFGVEHLKEHVNIVLIYWNQSTKQVIFEILHKIAKAFKKAIFADIVLAIECKLPQKYNLSVRNENAYKTLALIHKKE